MREPEGTPQSPGAAPALRVREVSVAGFRNLRGVRLSPGPEANLFVGANGQGKSSLLEAVDYVATLRSFRGATRAQLVGHGQPEAQLHLEVTGGELPHTFRVRIDRRTRETQLDGKRPERAVRYYGAAACVVFHPEDLELVRGAPELRRRLLDRILVRVLDGYGEALRSYARALRARNLVLRDPQGASAGAAAYEPLLARYGSAIVRARTALTGQLLPRAREAAEQIALTGEEIGLAYRTRTPPEEAGFERALREGRAVDVQRGSTQLGPHGDDVAVLWGRRVARSVASQGQTRALALALRLGELRVLQARTGYVPWLLLDDVSSELDRQRTERLFALVATLGAQLWVTTTDPAVASLLPSARRFEVRDGEVLPQG